MTRLAKLVVIGVVTGALGAVGCGSDETTGTGGSGSGGTGGTPEACSQDDLPDTGETGTTALTCSTGLQFDFDVEFNATETSPVQVGSNEFQLQYKATITPATIEQALDLIMQDSLLLEIDAVRGDVKATRGDSSQSVVEIVDQEVPCSLLLERGKEAAIITTVTIGSWNLDQGQILELTLENVTLSLTVLLTETGIPATLTTEGTSPTCDFVNDVKASVQFSAQ